MHKFEGVGRDLSIQSGTINIHTYRREMLHSTIPSINGGLDVSLRGMRRSDSFGRFEKLVFSFSGHLWNFHLLKVLFRL